jgi:hypothetical protein
MPGQARHDDCADYDNRQIEPVCCWMMLFRIKSTAADELANFYRAVPGQARHDGCAEQDSRQIESFAAG